ncbi:hypothetical protein CTAYLR_008906 [Chrysophaeum taylorii]|uniref:RING-type domain-containing protein n=1 Tax=Chrysophaeum taylorii TaxID=2483200 RepID=A0AAD7XRQ6_9STRA|nr:hypothetical protein CTAYLR_008906 [Chrysophaeum taylorii]
MFNIDMKVLVVVVGVAVAQTTPNSGQCARGTCDSQTCCTADGKRVAAEFPLLSSRLPCGGHRALSNSSVLCNCEDDDDPEIRTFRQSMVVVSILAMVALVAVMLVIFTRSLRPTPQSPERASSFQNLIELVYKTKVAESKAALVEESAERHADDRCAICLDALEGILARPPFCDHTFHRVCIERWIDYVQPPDRERGITDEQLQHPENTTRMLRCPVCSKPILDDAVDFMFLDADTIGGPSPDDAAAELPSARLTGDMPIGDVPNPTTCIIAEDGGTQERKDDDGDALSLVV